MDEQSKPEAPPKPPIRMAKHDPVASLFADGLFSASVTSGVARIELFVEQFDASANGMQPAIVGRLVMPVDKLESFVRALGEIVQRIQNEKKPKA
jgi:hypothetical protein